MFFRRRHQSFFNDSSIRSVQNRRKEEGVALQHLYVGIAVQYGPDNTLEIGHVFHDGTYSTDYEIETIDRGPTEDLEDNFNDDLADRLADKIIEMLDVHRRDNLYKFVGAGVNHTANKSPYLLSRLWQELDIVPILYGDQPQSEGSSQHKISRQMSVDEEADKLARKAACHFTNSFQPRVEVSHGGKVQVDLGGTAKIAHQDDYPDTVSPRTWRATAKYANSLIARDAKIAFFNATPQGGGVALMRHALIRFLYTQIPNVNASWYVPTPAPAVFRITKDNHNILQGVADPELRLTPENMTILDNWCYKNAERHWIKKGPLAPRSEGGADVIIVDDPQMPALVKIAKEQDPTRPVIFRSHIQVRADLANKPGTPTAEVWSWVWGNIKDADLFISHPVPDFVPAIVTPSKVGYLPATTDWLDGLNKDLDEWDFQFYIHEFQSQCFAKNQPLLDHPHRKYITQIARFDPAKGIPDLLASYALLRRKHMKDWAREDTPQLVLAGHGAIDDPDATRILKETEDEINTLYDDIKDDIIYMRLEPSDQLLNALMSGAHVALQLSTREGFEVKVSEALHKGIPVIATTRGGIPLQIQHGKSGFLVESGNNDGVAEALFTLFTDDEVYTKMANFARDNVSDEVSTVGNALAWLYMCDKLDKGEVIEPGSRWINDMAREEAEQAYLASETRLPRKLELH
ncbi:putative trehalose synthase-like protein [Massarina eburnea CBS 473.64]|uniref:Putative trehalose synthase-like protein n=1 Tax=Massarina eburnea CBS 473.64 TaxID=1395130 RepID=A0A6A6RQE0_9PLEO|nr:putative trehalose synthase-like protein [Massarina eburnea CBS 473.64]